MSHRPPPLLDPADPASAHRFIAANTRLLEPPLVPEIRLHLAEESIPIWQKTEEELGEMNVPPPFWAFAWAGGQALARYILDHPGLLAGRHVLCVGSGSGLEAIAAVKAGAATATAADIDAMAGAAARLNARANAVEISTTTRDLLDTVPECGALLVGDLFYEKPLAIRVLALIERLVPRGTLILVGDPRRSYFPRDRFVMIAEYDVPVTRELEDAELKRAAVWKPV
ncbi:MAG: 50S ribosomal protein L11 methyltransferase [Hyphomicrobiaceae bacterium]|nr:50S ribosomal protein L11 methyltransferase [Hyphomicrobiaceae bacterium]